jgi:hypothetical protein
MRLSLSNTDIQVAIRDLELEKEIKPIQKALILMVADDKKPATWQQIASEKWAEGTQETRITAKRWKELNNIFNKLGLKSSVRTRLDDSTFVQPKNGTHQWIELADIFLSTDRLQADRLAKAVESEDHRQVGILLGFPKSAVDAFISKNILPVSEWPTSTQHVDESSMRFLNHMVSKDNWEREINYLPAFSRRIEQLSSKIYQDCLKRFN